MKDWLLILGCLFAIAVFTALIWFSGYDKGREQGFKALKDNEPIREKSLDKTESEAWEATKMFVAASLDNGHTASFRGQRAVDVVRRTGEKSFTVRAIVWSRDADEAITPKEFECQMTHLEAGKWRGNLTLTEDRKVEPKPSGEVI
jgi:hypothetical protein